MKWNQQVVKLNNKQIILQAIRDKAPISRADLSQMLGLTKGTISSLVSELIEENLCLESGPGESSGGRRPVMLLFNDNAGYTIGIDVGVHYILGILATLDGAIIRKEKQRTDNKDYPAAVAKIIAMIHDLHQSVPESPYGVVGIGIGIPGIVNNEGDILLAPNLGWEHKNLRQEIENAFSIPVIIENEANAGAYAEKTLGAGQECDNMVYVSAGIGIGAGFILNGQLFKGANGISGEMGHMSIQYDGLPCPCGNKGCWELYASERALLRKAESLLPDQSDLSLEDLMNPEAHDLKPLFDEVGTFLGIGITNIANTFNPEKIIIGNRLAMAKDLMTDSIISTVKKRSLKNSQTDLQISFSNLSVYSAALGAAAFGAEHFLAMDLHPKKVNVF